ncbi:hypothetical protein B484DRAFT_405909 [Ochromonadaceae sp. CCMP2298]|nr:hypothetical protein B484DRAFT_405909 [Ochromonadaceae sp. CCMP2298]
MAKIYPVGDTKALNLHDSLCLVNCNWYVDNPKSLLKFIAVINEAVRLAEAEIRTARDDNTIRGLEQESVKILLERIIASKANCQPVQVRQQLKHYCTAAGRPATTDELITHVISNAERINYAINEDQQRKVHEALSRDRDIKGDKGKSFTESAHGRRYAAAGKSQLKYAEDEKGEPIAMGERPATAVKKEKKPWGDKKRTVLEMLDLSVDYIIGRPLPARLAMKGEHCLTIRGSPLNLSNSEV